MRKTILVRTNDYENRVFNLVVTGPVEKTVEVEPQAVYLDGFPGDVLQATVNITPSEKYGFSSLTLEKKNASKISANLIKPSGKDNVWKLIVQCTSEKVGDLFEEIILKSDSEFKPELSIKVSAIFIEKPDKP